MAKTPGKEVESQQSKIYALFVAGYPYYKIAELLNVDIKQVQSSVYAERKHLAQYVTEDERQARIHLEAERLDMLQSTFWQSAMAGDVKDADLVLKIMDRRAKLFGLDKGVEQTGSRQILVAGTKEEFLAALQQSQTTGLIEENGIVDAEVVEEEP